MKKRRKTYIPGKKNTIEFPKKPLAPKSPQLKLEGFTSKDLEEIEGAISEYKGIEDRVKANITLFKAGLDVQTLKLIEVLQKHKPTSIVIGGLSAAILNTLKVKVKGVKKSKAEYKAEKENTITFEHKGKSATIKAEDMGKIVDTLKKTVSDDLQKDGFLSESEVDAHLED